MSLSRDKTQASKGDELIEKILEILDVPASELSVTEHRKLQAEIAQYTLAVKEGVN